LPLGLHVGRECRPAHRPLALTLLARFSGDGADDEQGQDGQSDIPELDRKPEQEDQDQDGPTAPLPASVAHVTSPVPSSMPRGCDGRPDEKHYASA